MKIKPILLSLSFLIAASLACSFGASQTAPTPTSAPILAATEIAVSTGLPAQAPTPVSPVSQATVIATVPASIAQPGEIRQWAASATASSEYGNPDWAASQATGAPDVPTCSDDGHAWAASNNSTVEWLELTYATPVKPFEVNIYQTYNPGQIVKVELFSPDGQTSYLAYTATPAMVATCPQKLTLSLDGSNLGSINRIRITVDQSVLGTSWAEIDAVELVGVK
jgi:hypothetical protein